MKKQESGITRIVIFLLAFMIISCENEQAASDPTALDLNNVRELLQELDDEFSENFKNADSVALAEHYTTDGTLGSIKGKENLISAWGKTIRSSNEDGTPYFNFKINSVSNHGEFLVEIGTYEFEDINNIVKNTGKYLVVRKLEDGKWKIYRDIGL